MKGFALVRDGKGLKKVPHDSDDATGHVPQVTKDGEPVWNWTHRERSADTLIERRAAFLASRSGNAEPAERKPVSRKEGK